jgi:Ca2+-transporting ATPase
VPATSIETHDSTIAYLQSVSEVVAAFGTDEQHGLSDEEVRSRLERYGRNELTAEKPISSWRRFLAQFQDVLVILLLVAGAVSAALWFVERDEGAALRGYRDLRCRRAERGMGYIQEARAEAAVAALRAMSAADATSFAPANDGASLPQRSFPATSFLLRR